MVVGCKWEEGRVLRIDLQSPWLTLLRWCRPCCSRCCCCCRRRAVGAAAVVALPLSQLARCTLVRSPFLALALHLCVHARSLARWPPRSIVAAAAATPAAAVVALPLHLCTPALSLARWLPRSIATAGVAAPAAAVAGLPLRLRLQLPPRVHPRSLSLVRPSFVVRPSCAHPVFCLCKLPVKPKISILEM